MKSGCLVWGKHPAELPRRNVVHAPYKNDIVIGLKHGGPRQATDQGKVTFHTVSCEGR